MDTQKELTVEQQEFLKDMILNPPGPSDSDLLVFIVFPMVMAVTVVAVMSLAGTRANVRKTDVPFLYEWAYGCLLFAPYGIYGFLFGIVGVWLWYSFDASLGGLWAVWTTITGIFSWVVGLSLDISKRKENSNQ